MPVWVNLLDCFLNQLCLSSQSSLWWIPLISLTRIHWLHSSDCWSSSISSTSWFLRGDSSLSSVYLNWLWCMLQHPCVYLIILPTALIFTRLSFEQFQKVLNILGCLFHWICPVFWIRYILLDWFPLGSLSQELKHCFKWCGKISDIRILLFKLPHDGSKFVKTFLW